MLFLVDVQKIKLLTAINVGFSIRWDTMKNHYNRSEWRTFRKDMLRLHGDTCHRCERGEHHGVVLQVHHKFYIAGRLPWQYRPDECEVLCRGCHAEEHGRIMPKSGWEHFGDFDDLGGLDGNCELCATAIRYVFPIHHAKWGTLEVGEICCDHLTSTTFATERMSVKRKHFDKLKRFVCSSRWHTDKSGSPRIIQNQVALCVVRDGTKYRLQMNSIKGKLRFDSVLEAKIEAFDLIDSSAVRAFLQKQKLRGINLPSD
jgi:hypothetical protein